MSPIRLQFDQAQGQWVFFDSALQRQVDGRGIEAIGSASELVLTVTQQLADAYEAALKEIQE